MKPALDIVGIQYEVFKTTSQDYITEWVTNYENSKFNEYVLIGGDGLFSTFINAAYTYNPDILKKPIGILPGGT